MTCSKLPVKYTCPVTAPLLSRLIVTAIAAGQGIAPLFIDLNRTHATHPLWPGHARFHVVWQTFTLTLTSIVQIILIWWPSSATGQLFYLAAVLASLPMCGFLVAMLTRGIYDGTLHDPNGISPVRIRISGATREIDMNAVLVILGAGLLLGAVLVF